MTLMTTEDVEAQKKSFNDAIKRIENGDVQLAQRYVDAIEERPLTEQPPLNPKERSELLFKTFKNGSSNASGK